MNASASPVSRPENADVVLAEIVEEVTNKFHASEAVDAEVYIRAHPELAEQLRQLVPALQVLADFGHSATSGDAAGMSPAAVQAAELRELGDFRIGREVGRGGMGVVYEAVQISLGRRVALKMLPFAGALDPKQLQRFKNEAQAAALLHHTNIVPVHYVGCERGVHFYAMQYIEGQTLARVIADLRAQNADLLKRGDRRDRHAEEPASPPTGEYHPTPSLPHSGIGEPQTTSPPTQPVAGLSTEHSINSAAYFRTVANLGVQAAEALEHAHDQGVIHRDIKPANLMVDGRANLWVTDFGLAHCQNQAGLTMSGDLVGTLRYMSPEQALAKCVLVDHRTDIYSLGVTLYELLTLEPAFTSSDRQELLRQIAFEEPQPLRRLNKPIPTELETIVLKAMEKNPAERYATAQELADDLRRFLEDKPIRAKRPTLLQRAVKWNRRHPALMWSTVAITLILVASFGWILRDWLARRTEAEARVLEALAVAEPKLREGNAGDPELIAAARKAEAQLTSGVVRTGLRQRVEQLVADWQMLAKLENIRLLDSCAVKEEGKLDIALRDPAYAQAFREYGLDLDTLHPAEGAERIRATGIAVELATSLDDWAAVCKRTRNQEDATWKKLLTIARAADPDPWRNQLRDVLDHWRYRVGDVVEQQDRSILQELAASGRSIELPPSTLQLVGRTLQAAKMNEEAVTLLRKIHQHHPSNFWVNFYLAYSLHQMHQPMEAMRFYTATLALRPQSSVVHNNLGNVLRETGALDEAITAYREAIRLEPASALNYTNLGLALGDKRALDEAIRAFREAIRIKPDSAPAYHGLGVTHSLKGALDEAIAAWKEAIHLNPDYVEAYSDLGVDLLHKGALDEAIAASKKAIRLKPDFADAHFALGDGLRGMHAWDEAIAAYKDGLRLKPDHVQALNNLGMALSNKGALAESIAAFKKALTLKPDHVDALNNLGITLCQKGAVDEGIMTIKKAIDLKPDAPLYHCSLGKALAEKGQHEEAIASFREAIRHDEHFVLAHSMLGVELASNNQLDEAIACFREVVKLKKDEPAGYNDLGCALALKASRTRLSLAIRRPSISINITPWPTVTWDAGSLTRVFGMRPMLPCAKAYAWSQTLPFQIMTLLGFGPTVRMRGFGISRRRSAWPRKPPN
jgi:tetratricopeptide (TPR) repeat protein